LAISLRKNEDHFLTMSKKKRTRENGYRQINTANVLLSVKISIKRLP